MRLLTVLFIFTLHASRLLAQTGNPAFFKALQGRLHYGFIFAHSESVQNTAGANPVGLDLEFVKQSVDTTTWDLCLCYPVKGWSFSYFNYDSRVLGHGLSVAYFLEPAYRVGRKSQFRFRGGAGLSYLTRPFDRETNPTNMSYSLPVNGFLQLGMSWSYVVAPQWSVQLGAQYQHISNGGLKDPNKGINSPTALVGVTYFARPYQLPVYSRRNMPTERWKPYLDAGIFLGAKQGYQTGGQTRRTPLAGLLLQGEKQVGRTSALNLGIEFYYDNALHQKLQNDSADGSAYRGGVLAGHNFLLGRFQFSQQLGVYFFQRSPYYDRLYHRWVLRYGLNSRWMTGLGMKAHRHVADFIDVRLLYRF